MAIDERRAGIGMVAAVVAFNVITHHVMTAAADGSSTVSRQYEHKSLPMAVALAHSSGGLRLTSDSLFAKRDVYQVECFTENGETLAVMNWDAKTARLLSITNRGYHQTGPDRGNTGPTAALAASREWLQLSQGAIPPSEWRERQAPEQGTHHWLLRLQARNRQADLVIDSVTGDLVSAAFRDVAASGALTI